VNASQRDKDFILALNWKMAAQLVQQGKGTTQPATYAHNVYNEGTHSATSTIETQTILLDAKQFPGLAYFIPCPKSPHGCDVDPTGNYIVGSGKLAALIPFSVLINYKKRSLQKISMENLAAFRL
jgi:nitrous-oxide reductase